MHGYNAIQIVLCYHQQTKQNSVVVVVVVVLLIRFDMKKSELKPRLKNKKEVIAILRYALYLEGEKERGIVIKAGYTRY
jgi:hypothetical protein